MTENNHLEFKNKSFIRPVIGLLVSSIGVIILFIGFSVAPAKLILVVVSISLMIGGFTFYMYNDRNYTHVVRFLDIIHDLKCDSLITKRSFLLAKKNSLYILSVPNFSGIFFIKFRNLRESNNHQIHIPKLLTTKGSGGKIDNSYIYKARGTCNIPITEKQYGKGDADLYFTLTERIVSSSRIRLGRIYYPTFRPMGKFYYPISYPISYSSDTLLKIIHILEEECDLKSATNEEKLISYKKEEIIKC
ncbi:MAG: hypothetical protein ACFFAO_09765 [Candidatus Hermodarchaeota archaeon]